MSFELVALACWISLAIGFVMVLLWAGMVRPQ